MAILWYWAALSLQFELFAVKIALMLCVMVSNFFDIRHLNRIKKISLVIIRMKYIQTLE